MKSGKKTRKLQKMGEKRQENEFQVAKMVKKRPKHGIKMSEKRLEWGKSSKNWHLMRQLKFVTSRKKCKKMGKNCK